MKFIIASMSLLFAVNVQAGWNPFSKDSKASCTTKYSTIKPSVIEACMSGHQKSCDLKDSVAGTKNKLELNDELCREIDDMYQLVKGVKKAEAQEDRSPAEEDKEIQTASDDVEENAG